MINKSLKRNIAIIIPGGIGTGFNNIGVPVLERIIKLLSSDFNLTVFQLFPVNEKYTIEGLELIPVYSSHSIIKSLKFFFIFLKVHRQRHFDAVHGFWVLPGGFLAVVMGKIFKIKSIVSVLGGDAIALPEIQYGQLRSSLYTKLILWALYQANEVNALTQYLLHNLKKAGLTRNDIKIIPWGVDTELFSFQERPLQKPVQFLHIANLHPVKDQETLLRAFKMISDQLPAHLTIIGEGISKSDVVSLIAELNLKNKVTMLGLFPYEELPGFYNKADLLLHTSLSEGQCEVVTEAMSCGVLVCGTRVGLMHDLPDCCISVLVRDHTALALETIQLVRDPERIKTLRQRAHRWTTEHSITWTVEKIKALYLF